MTDGCNHCLSYERQILYDKLCFVCFCPFSSMFLQGIFYSKSFQGVARLYCQGFVTRSRETFQFFKSPPSKPSQSFCVERITWSRNGFGPASFNGIFMLISEEKVDFLPFSGRVLTRSENELEYWAERNWSVIIFAHTTDPLEHQFKLYFFVNKL